jgi:maleylpyruvate isomerase
MQLRVEDVGSITGAVIPLQQRLQQAVAWLSDAEVFAPSRLPGWTRGHVLTHLARNAEGHVGMLEGALRGEPVPQYAGGADGRAADIEAGAKRPAAEQVRDLGAWSDQLVESWSRMTAEAWNFGVPTVSGPKPAWRTAWSRWREVEIHWVDLGIDLLPQDWSRSFVELALPEQVDHLSGRLPGGASVDIDDSETGRSWRVGPVPGSPAYHVEGSSALLLAWLIGRLDHPAAELTAPDGLPELPPWA